MNLLFIIINNYLYIIYISIQGEGYVKRKADIRVTHLQVKECQPPEVRPKEWNRFSLKTATVLTS